jgi:hypothetical protein
LRSGGFGLRLAQAKKSQDPISMNRGEVVRTYHPSDGKKHKIGGSWSRSTGAKSKTFSPKQPEQNGLVE